MKHYLTSRRHQKGQALFETAVSVLILAMFLAAALEALLFAMSYFQLGFMTEHVAEVAALSSRGYNASNPLLGNPVQPNAICADIDTLTAPLVNLGSTYFYITDPASSYSSTRCADGATIVVNQSSSSQPIIDVSAQGTHSFLMIPIGPQTIKSSYSISKGAYNYVTGKYY